MILNERILRIILTLAEDLHFGRAAARLHVSQSALSGSVKNIERDLGVCLFRRTSRHVELTDAGHVFAAEAGRLIHEAERAVARVRGSSQEILGPLHIGYPASINLRWLCSMIADSRSNALLAPGLQFVSTDAASLHSELMKGSLDACFFAGLLCDPDLQSVTLLREPLTMILCSSHPLAQSSFLELDQVQEEPVIWIRRDVNPPLYDSIMDLCSSQGYRPKVVQEVRTFDECLEFARNGLGITFLPSFVQANYRNESVVFVRLPEGTLHADYKLAFRRNAGSSVCNFVRFVQDRVSWNGASGSSLLES